jgi:hypothetical protein
VQEIRPGDVVHIEPDEDHWHGATPDRLTADVSMQGWLDDQGEMVTGLAVLEAERIRQRDDSLEGCVDIVRRGNLLPHELMMQLPGGWESSTTTRRSNYRDVTGRMMSPDNAKIATQ